jgi:F0F1-type ATP synthase alpha subunit
MEQEQLLHNKINGLKVEIFDFIRQQEPLVIQRDQLITMANNKVNEINNEITRLEGLKSPKTRELLELEKTEKKVTII